MDPIAWEILSHLAEARGGNGDDGSVDSLPFYAQRICKEEDTNTSLIQEESLFFKTSPTIHYTTQSPSDNSPTIYSLKAITEKFMHILQQQQRVSVAELCLCLGMKDDDVSAVGDLICKSSSSVVCKVYNNVGKQYEYGLVESLKKSLHDRINFHCNSVSSTSSLEDKSLHSIVSSLAQLSTVTIKQLSKELELSCEDILRLLKDIELHPNICILKHNEEIITGLYNNEIKENRVQYIEKQILSCLDEVTTPSSLNSILFGQDDVDEASARTIVSIVNKLYKKGALSGTISIPVASTSKIALVASLYTPQVYSNAQQQLAISFYKTNGYLKFTSFGISRSKIQFMEQCLPNSVMLGNSLIIDLQKICLPITNDIENAILTQSFANLKVLLPDDIKLDEVRELIDVHLVSVMKNQSDIFKAFNEGLSIIDENIVFFFCSEMIKSCKEMILKLIEEYSISRAKQMTVDQDMIIPLRDIVQCIGNKYTDLLDMQNQHDQNHCIGPLVKLCRVVFSEELQQMCIQAVKAEMDRINSTLHGVSVSTRTEAASTIQHVKESFESSFRSLCHLLQIMSKSIDTIHSRNNINVNEMYNELLKGCGSCLAKIISEHYMFKNETDDNNDLSFYTEEDKNEQSISTLVFPTYSLHCQNGEARCPFSYLRSLFPGSDGKSLSQMWSLCTDESGEDDINDDNSQDLDASKRLELFISHLTDNCLALIGLPFSVLDKKTEKKILLARREGLLNRLDCCTDKEEIVMCATALLYQQIKTLTISGKHTITSVLQNLLTNDKKIPEEVTKALQTLRDCDLEDQELIGQVKRFASAKNSKALLALVNDN